MTGTRPPTIAELFRGLTTNAVEYLVRAAEGFESSPKHSLICFCSGLELFLKARLMAEHWTLVLLKPEEADLEEFCKGNFRSVSIERAISRLGKVLGRQLPGSAAMEFNKIRCHRNALVHFCHPDYDSSPGFRAEAARQQCVAWFHLIRLIHGPWAAVFEPLSGEIAEAESAMRRQRMYLQVRFDGLQDRLEAARSHGGGVVECPSCGFEASLQKPQVTLLRTHECLVCEAQSVCLHVPCPACGSDSDYWNDRSSECKAPHCRRPIGQDDVLRHLAVLWAGRGAKEQSEVLSDLAACGECEVRAVVPFDGGFLCAACLTRYDAIYECASCRAPCAGQDPGNSWLVGCSECRGRDRFWPEELET